MSRMKVGWKEHAKLEKLGINNIKVKIDTGAKTSSIHALDIKTYQEDGKDFVEFKTTPLRKKGAKLRSCKAEVVDYRKITSSNGQTQARYVIRTPITIGDQTWNIDVTLAERKKMRYKMLLGREAMKNILVSPTESYLQDPNENDES